MQNLTQVDIDKKAEEIKKGIVNTSEFLYNNYKILLKKKNNTRLELILIDDCIKKTLYFKSPEHIDFNLKTVCFYLALEHYNVPCEKW